MTKALVMAFIAALLVSGAPASAQDTTRKKSHSTAKKDKDKKKAEAGASCKAPALGACASCAITCRPGETATCASGQLTADMCTRQPQCLCK